MGESPTKRPLREKVFAAIWWNQVDRLENLVNTNLRALEMRDHGRFTCLQFACLQNVNNSHISTINYLLEKNCDVDDNQNHDRHSALHLLVENGGVDVINLVLKKEPNLEIANAQGESILHTAIRHNNVAAIKILIKAGANVHQEDIFHRTPLDFAARFSSPEVYNSILIRTVSANLPQEEEEEDAARYGLLNGAETLTARKILFLFSKISDTTLNTIEFSQPFGDVLMKAIMVTLVYANIYLPLRIKQFFLASQQSEFYNNLIILAFEHGFIDEQKYYV